MLGALTERLALVAAAHRRALLATALVLYGLGALAFVELPRPRDFAADLPAAHPVAQARLAQREFPVVLLRVEPADPATARNVLDVLAPHLADGSPWLGLSARAGAEGGSTRAIREASAVAAQLPPLEPLSSLPNDANLARGLEALSQLPATAPTGPVVEALADVLARGKGAPGDTVVNAVRRLVRWPEGAAQANETWRLRDGGLDLWLRARPKTAPDVLRRDLAPLVAEIRKLGLRVRVDGQPFLLNPGAAPRWHGMLAAVPLAVAGGLAWALGVPLLTVALALLGAGAVLALPLALLLFFERSLDPAATWAHCAAGGLVAALMLFYLGLYIGRAESPDPPLRRARHALRDSILAAGLGGALCLLAALGTRWAAPAASATLAGAAFALPLYWGLLLPAAVLFASELQRGPGGRVLIGHMAWAPPGRFRAGLLALAAVVGAAALFQQGSSEARPPEFAAGVPIVLPVPADDAQARLGLLRHTEGVAAVEGPARPSSATDRLALEAAAARATARFPLTPVSAVEVAEDPSALEATLTALAAQPAWAGHVSRLRAALAQGSDDSRALRLYLAGGTLRHAVERLRTEARAVLDRARATEAPTPFFEAGDGRALLVVVPAATREIATLANPLDGFVSARGAPLVGGVTWLTAAFGVALLSLVGLVAASTRFTLLSVPPLAASLPVLRAHALLDVPVSTLNTAAGWAAGIAATIFSTVVLRMRTGAPTPRGLRMAVALTLVLGLTAASFVVRETPFGPPAAVALVAAALAMAITYLTA